MSGVELERKFRVTALPDDLARHRASRILQGYLVIGADGSEARVRRRDDGNSLTVKQGRGLARLEEEIEITPGQFDRLWPLTERRRIEKWRYEIPLAGGLVVELDVYEGALAGLLIAEVEFRTMDAAERFVAPPWLGAEVTHDDAYKNRRLAIDGLPPG
jgi:CYTH domain-containing protein